MGAGTMVGGRPETMAAPSGMEIALLALVRERPMHAYEMHQRLAGDAPLGRVWRLKQGNLYALLAKLEEHGYLAATTQPQGTRPPRKVLAPTAAGEAAYAAWLTAPVAHGRDFRVEFLAKLACARGEGTGAVRALLVRQRTATDAWLAAVHEQAGGLPPGEAGEFDRLVLAFRRSQLEAILGWLDACAAELLPGESSLAALPHPPDQR